MEHLGRFLLALSPLRAPKVLISSLEMASTYGSDSWPGSDCDSWPAEKRAAGRYVTWELRLQ